MKNHSILTDYLLRVALRALRVFLEPLRPLRVLRLPPRWPVVACEPPLRGIVVGHPIPPGKLHQT